MRPESPSPTMKSPSEKMVAERPVHSGNGIRETSSQDEMSHETPEQEQQYGHSKAEQTSARYLQTSAATVGAKQMEDFSQSTGENSISLDENQNKWGGSVMKMINGAFDRIVSGDATQERQKTRQSAYKERPTPIGHRDRPAPKPREQGPGPRLQKQGEAAFPHIHGETPKSHVQSERDANRLREVTRHAQHLEAIVRTLREDLNKTNKKVATLEKALSESEAIITQAHATAVSTLAGNVSRGVTDDTIREEFKKFFQSDFFSWCADLCAERIVDEKAALHKLLESGIINSSEKYLNGPGHLRFNMNTPDGSSPLVLLQGALARRLCLLYLSDAYFLAEALPMNHKGRSLLCHFERCISQARPDAAIDWRIQTVECLEKSVSVTEEYIQRDAQDFAQEYEFLLSADRYDHEASQDLVQIFTDFATLALKVWKTRANIEWSDTASFAEDHFELGHPWLEVNQSLTLRMGQRLNGRPIGLIIRPLIGSTSLSKNGKVETVVWHKALAWVSGEEEPMVAEKLEREEKGYYENETVS